MDLEILAVFRQRENYDKYARFVKPSSLTSESFQIFLAMGEWYKSNSEAKELNVSAFSAWASLVRFAKMDRDKLQAIKSILSVLDGYVIEEHDMKPLIEGLAKRDFAAQIAEHALRIADGDYSLGFDRIDDLTADFNRFVGHVDTLELAEGSFSLDSLESVTGPGLEWRLKCLRESCGDIRKGDFIV